MKRLKRYAASLLLGVVIAATDFEAVLVGLLVPMWKIVYVGIVRLFVRLGLTWLVVRLVGPARRIKYRAKYYAAVAYLQEMRVLYWDGLPRFVRVPLKIVCGVFAGVILFVLSFTPLEAEILAVARSQFRGRFVPFLTRTAAAHGVVKLSPDVWNRAPSGLRERCARWYIALGWWTNRRIVAARMGIGRLHRREIKRKALKED